MLASVMSRRSAVLFEAMVSRGEGSVRAVRDWHPGACRTAVSVWRGRCCSELRPDESASASAEPGDPAETRRTAVCCAPALRTPRWQICRR